MMEILYLYKFLKGKYRITTILAHAYKESIYANTKQNKTKLDAFRDHVLSSVKESGQVIINIHDGALRSGGLTDRLKGICTLYMIAKRRNLNFRIFFVSPFDLKKYLAPNIYDWTIDASEISHDLNTTAIYTWENEELADYFFNSSTAYNQLHISCNSGECTNDYSKLFNELFKPTNFLSSKIDSHISMLGGVGKYISISFRFQNLLGEFQEAASVALREDDKNNLIKECLRAIEVIKEAHADIEKVLITSDSNDFREIASANYHYVYSYTLPNEIGHIDYAGSGKSKELTAFIDMFLIANAKKAYQVRSKEMYNSDFPNMAAKINDVLYEMIILNGD